MLKLWSFLKRHHFIGCYWVWKFWRERESFRKWINYIDGKSNISENVDIYCIDSKKQMYLGEGIGIGKNTRILLHFPGDTSVPPTLDYGRIFIGDNVSIGNDAFINVYSTVIIEKNCLFGEKVTIRDSNHGMDLEATESYVALPLDIKPVTIKEGCWLGQGVEVNPGVTIGKRCIIGTRAVVTRDIPDYCMAVGVPARVIKKWNFDTHQWERVGGGISLDCMEV